VRYTESMSWISVALGGYFFNAVTAILDKYILSSRIPQPSVNALLVALMSVFVLVLLPFGVTTMSVTHTLLACLSGMLFIYHLIPFYTAIKKGEVSRVAPLIAAFTALWLLPFVFVSEVAVGEGWVGGVRGMLAFLLLLGGGVLIALRLPMTRGRFFEGFSQGLTASVLLAISVALLKYVYTQEGFLNGFFWSRLGSFAGGITLLLTGTHRRVFFHGWRFSISGKQRLVTVGAVLANKVSATLGAVLVSYAIFLGPLVFVQALSGVQFAFVFLLGLGLSWKYPQVYGESMLKREWMQKTIAIILITLGIVLAQ
jgi:uncharacterized membrane protein